MAESVSCSETVVPLTCSVCLDRLKNPKLLACHHTFCETCIASMVTNSMTAFIQCPQCRKRMHLTWDKVPLLQTNFYLTPLLEESQNQDCCDVHTSEKLRFVCLDCDKAICCECVLQNHKQHDLKDFSNAKEVLRAEIHDGMADFDAALSDLRLRLEERRLCRQLAEDGRSSFERVIRERARELCAIISGQVEKALMSAKKMVDSTEGGDVRFTESISAIENMKEKMKMTWDKKTNYKDLKTASKSMKEMKEITLNDIIWNAERSHPQGFPTLSFDNNLPKAKTIASLLGKLQMGVVFTTIMSSTVSIHKAFHCCPENPSADLFVHALCFDRDGDVWVAYGAPHAQGEGLVARFSQTGHKLNAAIETKGKVCLAGVSDGCVRVEGKHCGTKDLSAYSMENSSVDEEKLYDVYNKTKARFLLRQYASRESELKCVTASGCEDSFVSKILTQTPVAMDASQDGNMFAVVEEGQSHVPLFHREAGLRPFSVFRGRPGELFEPLDVCFYTIGGEETLVVADGASMTLRVLRVGKDFGCELVNQIKVVSCDMSYTPLKPTALCPDMKGQLWVGCQGGCIMCVASHGNLT